MADWFALAGSAWFNLLLLIILLIILVLVIVDMYRIHKIKKEYHLLMKKFGNEQNLNEIFKDLMHQLEDVSRETKSLKTKTEEMQNNIEKCIQKVGIVRYKAYLNEGSDLCFAVALLDSEDTGVVINGIYSRDNTTTTYAKPIEKGKSKYTLVKEEVEAIEIARHNGYNCYLNMKEG